MKKLKKLTRNQKQFLEKQKLNSRDYLLERDTTKEYVFYNVKTQELQTIKK